MDLAMDTMFLKDPFVLFGSERSALILPLLLRSLCISIALLMFLNKDKRLISFHGTEWPFCANTKSILHPFIFDLMFCPPITF